jgi:hypothetical protein
MYFPQSQIKTNLSTNGSEFVTLLTNENYIGSYWSTSSGKYYTKKNPQDTPYEELIKFAPLPLNNNSSVSILGIQSTGSIENLNPNYETVRAYDLARGVDVNNPEIRLTPQYFLPTPTEKDYSLGAFTRYICKRTNQDIYIEINKDTYNGLKDASSEYLFSLYEPFTITWTISGGSISEISKTNLKSVSLVEKQNKYKGLVRYFKNYSQFVKPN